MFIEKLLCVPSFASIDYCMRELNTHLCHYYNVWPEVVYCYFTRTINYLPVSIISGIGCVQQISSRLAVDLASYMAMYVPIGLRLFIAVLQELHCL